MGRRLFHTLAFAPALAAAALVWTHAVNVPLWDDWERASLVEAWEEGTLDLAQLYAPHIEHRIVIPRLLMLANIELTGGNLVYEIACIFAAVCAQALALAALARRTLAPERAIPATFLVNLVVFSPLGWENYLWAIQTAFVLPLACLALALLVLTSRLSWRVRFAACLVTALVATHSFGHGLILWAVVPAIALLGSDTDGGRRTFLRAWGLAAAIVLVPYFAVGEFRNESLHAYEQDPGEAPPAIASAGDALDDPAAAALFALRMLGSPLARNPRWPATAVAPFVGAALLAAFLVVAWCGWRRQAWRRPALPWIALGATAVTLAGVTTVGRLAVTFDAYAMVPRYTTVTALLVVALVGLAALLLPRRLALAAGTLLLAAQLLQWRIGVEGMRVWREARLHARAPLVYIDHFEPRYHHRLDPSVDVARRAARLLDRYGHLDPPLADGPDLEPFALAAEPGEGRILRIQLDGDVLALSGRSAGHGVLLVQRGEGRVLALGEARIPVRGKLREHDHLFNAVEGWHDGRPGRWEAEIPVSALPDSQRAEIEVFSIDAESMRIARLPAWVLVHRTPAGLVAEIRRAPSPS